MTRILLKIRQKLWYLAPIGLGVGLIWLISLGLEALQPEPDFEPIRILPLVIEPNVAEVGETVHLNNGVCNDSNDILEVQITLFAQEVTPDPIIMGRTVSLVDPPRTRAVLPGCFGEEGFDGPIPESLRNGTWRLVATIDVEGPNGEEQSAVGVSEPFMVLE